MHSEDLKFYKDDEGIAVDLILTAFSLDEVQCINLDSKLPDQKMIDDIAYLISHQDKLAHKIQEEVNKYCFTTYNKSLADLKLLKLYVFPDEEKEYGFMFSTTIDREHGVGVKLKCQYIEKIGSSETAFM